MTEKRQSLRWRKKPPPSGLMAMVTQPSHQLRLGETVVATATRRREGGWYWVARADEIGVPLLNTSGMPVETDAEAKAAAMYYVKECLAACQSAANPEEASTEADHG